MRGSPYAMSSTRRFIGAVCSGLLLALWVLLVLTALGFATGCAVGQSLDGDGFVIGTKIDDANSVAKRGLETAAGFLPPPWNYLATGAVTVLFGGGAAVAGRKRAEASQRERDAAWDEASARSQPIIINNESTGSADGGTIPSATFTPPDAVAPLPGDG